MGRRGQERRKNWLVNDDHGYLLRRERKKKRGCDYSSLLSPFPPVA